MILSQHLVCAWLPVCYRFNTHTVSIRDAFHSSVPSRHPAAAVGLGRVTFLTQWGEREMMSPFPDYHDSLVSDFNVAPRLKPWSFPCVSAVPLYVCEEKHLGHYISLSTPESMFFSLRAWIQAKGLIVPRLRYSPLNELFFLWSTFYCLVSEL